MFDTLKEHLQKHGGHIVEWLRAKRGFDRNSSELPPIVADTCEYIQQEGALDVHRRSLAFSIQRVLLLLKPHSIRTYVLLTG